jgi:hypothetical protein
MKLGVGAWAITEEVASHKRAAVNSLQRLWRILAFKTVYLRLTTGIKTQFLIKNYS